MENTKTLNALDEFAKAKPKEIPGELDEYLRYVAATGDPVYQWSLVKILFRQKLQNVIMDFFETGPLLDVPLSPNLDIFNFEVMKRRLLERYDTFSGVPFTIQRIAELLTDPKKQYSRVDKYMRALEKNIWVVSTREAICRELSDATNLVNGALHSNNGTTPTDRLKRQPDAFDNEEDDEELVEPEAVVTEEQYSYETVPEQITEIVAEADSSDTPVSAELISSDAIPPDNQDACHASEETLQDQSSNDEPPEEPVSNGSPSDNATLSLADETAPPVENVQPEVSLADEVTTEVIEEEREKTDEITITEIGSDASAEPDAEELTQAPLIVEPASENASAEIIVQDEEKEKVDLKRKINEVIGDDDETPNKKIGCTGSVSEELSKLVEEEAQDQVSVETSETCEGDAVVQEETTDKSPEAAVDETIYKEAVGTETIEVEAESTTETEGEMESAPFEEKTEMVVEEPDLSMDVDETSVQSPMVQEDIVEPMEATDQGSN